MKRILLICFVLISVLSKSQNGFYNGWGLNGNVVGSNTNFIGPTDNRSLLFKTNNVERFKVDSLGYCVVKNTVIEKGTLEVISAGNTSVSIGGVYGGGVGAIWVSQAPTKTDVNFQIAGAGNSVLILNAPNDSGKVDLSAGNNKRFIRFNGSKSYATEGAVEIGDNTIIRTRVGATFNFPTVWKKRYTTNWLAGTVPTQWDFYLEGNAVSATAASTITNYYAQWNAVGTASTNMAITNNWGFGTAGMAHITSSVLIGTTARTPSATLDVTGTASFSGVVYTGTVQNSSANLRLSGSGVFDFYNNTSLLNEFTSTLNIFSKPTKIGSLNNPASSSVLDLESTTKGFLPPRMTAAQGSAISSPAEGLMIYVTDTDATFTAKGWWGYNGATWEKLNN